VEFQGEDDIRVYPVHVDPRRIKALQDHMMLF
jgi:galactokinase/mevalonate kinase-like predicted kinase